jgi:TolA-binding protein
LLKQGRFSEIVGEAKALGAQRTLASRPIADLEALGQAARYTGDAGLAEGCWKAIRSRAPDSSAARQGAFFLGRVMEQQGRRADAIQWFARYREESPSGVFAGQALGRQMVLTSGRGGSARGLARDYLDRFPNGPYAKAARGVLGEKSQGSGATSRDDADSAE